MRQQLNQSEYTGQVGAGWSGVDHTWRGAQVQERAGLAFAIELSRHLPHVPSPAQAATVGWRMLWCIKDSHIDSITSCIAACYGSALNDLPHKQY